MNNYKLQPTQACWYLVQSSLLLLRNTSEWHYETVSLQKPTRTEMAKVSGYDKEQKQKWGPCSLPSHPQTARAYNWRSERSLESAKT